MSVARLFYLPFGHIASLIDILRTDGSVWPVGTTGTRAPIIGLLTLQTQSDLSKEQDRAGL